MLNNARLQPVVLTQDAIKSVQFYRDVLGLEHKGRLQSSDLFQLDRCHLLVSQVPDHKPSGHTTLGFAVADIGSSVAALRDRGIDTKRFAGISQDEAGILRLPGARVAWFSDPAGNLLSIVEYDGCMAAGS